MWLSLTLAACSGPRQQAQAPSASATSPGGLTSTPAPLATSTSSLVPVEDTPRPVATPDMTETTIQAFSATAEAVSTDVAAQGGGWLQVEGTLGALGLLQSPTPYALATATPLPFPVSTQQVRVSWGVATEYSFANPKDLLAARQAYERYLDFLSFRAGPPPDNLEDELATHMVRDGSGHGPFSCLFADTSRGVTGKASQGRYIRLTPKNGLTWDDSRVFLDVSSSGITTALGWRTRDVLVELVEIKTGKVVKQARMNMAGTAHLTYVSDSGKWLMEDDNGGFYCEWIGYFD